jgi:hypothetical protein
MHQGFLISSKEKINANLASERCNGITTSQIALVTVLILFWSGWTVRHYFGKQARETFPEESPPLSSRFSFLEHH